MMIATALTCLLGALASQSLSDASELKGMQLKPNGANGVSVLLDVDAPTAYKMTRSANGSTELILPNTQLPEAFQKTGLPGITDPASGINATVTQRSGDVKIQLTPASTKTQQKSIQVTLSGARPSATKPIDPGMTPEEKVTQTQATRPKHKAATALGDKPSADRPLVEQLFRQLQATVKPPEKPTVIPATPAKVKKTTPRLNPFKPLVAVGHTKATSTKPVPVIKTAQTVSIAAKPMTPVRGWGAGSSQAPSKLYTIPSAAATVGSSTEKKMAETTVVTKLPEMKSAESMPDRATMGLDAASQNKDLLETPDVSDVMEDDDLLADTPKTISGYPPIEPEGLPKNTRGDYQKAPEIKDWPWLSWMTSAGIMIMGLSMLGLAFLIFRIRRSAPNRPIGLGYNDPRRVSHYEMAAAAQAHRASPYVSQYTPEPMPIREGTMRDPRGMNAMGYRERSFEPDMDTMNERPHRRQTASMPTRPMGAYPHRDPGHSPEPAGTPYYDENPIPSAYESYEPYESYDSFETGPQPVMPPRRQRPMDSSQPKPKASMPKPMPKAPLYRDELYPDLDLPSERRHMASQPSQQWVEPDMDDVVEQVIADWQASQAPNDTAKMPQQPAKKPFGMSLNLFKKQQPVADFRSHPTIDGPLISSSRRQAAYSSYEDRPSAKSAKLPSFQVDDEALDQLYTQGVGFEPDWIPEKPAKTKTRLDKPKAIQRRSLLETSALRQGAQQDPYFDDSDPAPIRPSYAQREVTPPMQQQRRAIRYSPRR